MYSLIIKKTKLNDVYIREYANAINLVNAIDLIDSTDKFVVLKQVTLLSQTEVSMLITMVRKQCSTPSITQDIIEFFEEKCLVEKTREEILTEAKEYYGVLHIEEWMLDCNNIINRYVNDFNVKAKGFIFYVNPVLTKIMNYGIKLY